MTGRPGARDDLRADAFLARARALSAADWGRLDAIARRLNDGTPWARWRRARLDADRFEVVTRLFPRTVAVGGAAVIRAATDVGRWLGAQPTPDPFAPPRRPVQRPDDPRLPEPGPEVRASLARRERATARLAELRRIAREAPAARRAADGGAPALWILEAGLLGLHVHHVDVAVAERLYAPVEPVIPFASLDGTQPRVPPSAG